MPPRLIKAPWRDVQTPGISPSPSGDRSPQLSRYDPCRTPAHDAIHHDASGTGELLAEVRHWGCRRRSLPIHCQTDWASFWKLCIPLLQSIRACRVSDYQSVPRPQHRTRMIWAEAWSGPARSPYLPHSLAQAAFSTTLGSTSSRPYSSITCC
jgi:hypothetical protein